MKKFFILVFVLIFALLSFTGCKTTNSIETSETMALENGIVVTVDPVEETTEAENILNEISLNDTNIK